MQRGPVGTRVAPLRGYVFASTAVNPRQKQSNQKKEEWQGADGAQDARSLNTNPPSGDASAELPHSLSVDVNSKSPSEFLLEELARRPQNLTHKTA